MGGDVAGISGDILKRLKSVLLQCGPFSSDGALNATFVDARLAPWQDSIPHADDPQTRVNFTIEFLQDQESAEGENALVLLLRILSGDKDPGDACHRRLVQLAHDLSRALSGFEASEDVIVPFVDVAGATGFVNREDELQRLNVERLRASRSPYTLINAPAGYGKSHLLKRLANDIQADDVLRARWRFRYVDLRSQAPKSGEVLDPLELGEVSDPELGEVSDPELGEVSDRSPSPRSGDLRRTTEDRPSPRSGDLRRTTEDRPSPRSGDFRRTTEDQVTYIMRALMGGEMPDPSPDLATRIDYACDYILHKLTLPPSPGRERPAVLLIFDGVERLEAAVQQWLYDLLYVLRQRIQPGYREIFTVRVIIAGRNVEAFWEGYQRAHSMPPAPQRINLSPFDQYAIQDLIWRRVEASQIPLDDQTVIQIATEVAYLSGGHPKVICGLVDDLAEQLFAIGPPVAYFARNRAYLVRRYLSPVADELEQSIAAPIRDAVKALSVFRRVSGNTVEALADAEVLPPETDAVDLLRDLIDAQLLKAQSVREPFYRDHLIRRVLSLDAAYRSAESRAHYMRLNALALDLYAGWIHEGLQDPYLGPTQRLLSVVEWLFHALQAALQADDMSEQDVRTALRGHLEDLTETSDLSTVRTLIMKEIREDVELCYLLDHCLGEQGDAILEGLAA
jgi:hypothetical protein